MKQKMMFLALTLFILGAASVNAQVTIGSTDDPHVGAVLDLQSTTQGLKLPNVALNSDLTQFVLPENETSTPENAAGMLVFNTNPDIGAGTYVWTGTKWNRVDNEHGAPGPDLVVGSNTYRTYIYPRHIGTWMLDPSKEGTPDFTQYPGKTEGERGYYYYFENAASACPAGWRLPDGTDFTLLINYLRGHGTKLEFEEWTRVDKMSGVIVGTTSGWWGEAIYAHTSVENWIATFWRKRMNVGEPSAKRAISVFCIKDPNL
jgi:hypothetical protein